MDALIAAISEFFRGIVGAELATLICAMFPIIELRGAIPLAAGMGIEWYWAFLLAVVGNMIPVPFILLFIRKILSWMEASRVKFFNKVATWLRKKAEKNRPKIEKYSFWGLCLFVGIPLPMTGAWTGSLVAAFIDMKFWKAMLSAFLGVLMAATIVTLVAYGALGFLSFIL